MDKQPSEAALTEARHVWRDCCELGLGDSEIVDRIATALAERERAALEVACKAVCRQCKHGRKLKLVDGVWSHGVLTPGLQWKPCAADAIRALMSELYGAKLAEVVYRYTVARVDDFGDAWQIHWEAEDHGGRATIAKSQLPDYEPTPGATVELRFDVLGGFLGGRVIEPMAEPTP